MCWTLNYKISKMYKNLLLKIAMDSTTINTCITKVTKTQKGYPSLIRDCLCKSVSFFSSRVSDCYWMWKRYLFLHRLFKYFECWFKLVLPFSYVRNNYARLQSAISDMQGRLEGRCGGEVTPNYYDALAEGSRQYQRLIDNTAQVVNLLFV